MAAFSMRSDMVCADFPWFFRAFALLRSENGLPDIACYMGTATAGFYARGNGGLYI